LTFVLTLAEVKFGCLIYLIHIILLSLRRTRTRVETSDVKYTETFFPISKEFYIFLSFFAPTSAVALNGNLLRYWILFLEPFTKLIILFIYIYIINANLHLNVRTLSPLKKSKEFAAKNNISARIRFLRGKGFSHSDTS